MILDWIENILFIMFALVYFHFYEILMAAALVVIFWMASIYISKNWKSMNRGD